MIFNTKYRKQRAFAHFFLSKYRYSRQQIAFTLVYLEAAELVTFFYRCCSFIFKHELCT